MRTRKDGKPDGRSTRVWPERVQRHGTANNYNYGCRCDLCRAAVNARAKRQYRAKHPVQGGAQ